MSQASFPASFAQQRLWFLDQLEPGTAAYNLVRAFRITGPLDVRALTSAIRAVVRRHEALRTVFETVEGEARQVVLSDVDVQVPIVDVTHLPRREAQSAALRIAGEEGKKPFDLTKGPLFRALLVRLSRDQYLLVLAMHHIVTDGWSISILFRELARCYEGFVNQKEPELPELPLQYVEYAQWQREYVSAEVLAKQVEYRKNKLAGAQTILKREPHYLANGAVAFVDSGQCGVGKVMKVTGISKGTWRRKICVPLNPQQATLASRPGSLTASRQGQI